MWDFSIYAQTEDRWRQAGTAAAEQRLLGLLKAPGRRSLPGWRRLIERAGRILSAALMPSGGRTAELPEAVPAKSRRTE